jgi:hypothetical protein
MAATPATEDVLLWVRRAIAPIAVAALAATVHYSGGTASGGRASESQPGALTDSRPHLPLTGPSAKAWVALREGRVEALPEKAPLRTVIAHVESALQRSGLGAGRVHVYVDPSGLRERAITLDAPAERAPSKPMAAFDLLQISLSQFAMSFYVYDGLVVIDTPRDDCPAEVVRTTEEAWTWFVLNEPAPARSTDERPLRDVLRDVGTWVRKEFPSRRAFEIVVDGPGLSLVNQSVDSRVSWPPKGPSLRASLALMLKQLGLGFWVRTDGALVITSPAALKEGEMIMGYDDLALSYSMLRGSAAPESKKKGHH